MEVTHDRSTALSSQGRALRRRHTSSTRSLDRSTSSLVDQSSQRETHRADRPEECARGVRPAGPRVRTTVTIPTRDGILARFVTFDGLADRGEHFALCFGDAATHGAAPLVRLHSECITGDVFGSLRCDCGAQLDRSIEMLDERGGIPLYLRQEGRGLGLLAKLDAYRLQDQ